MSDQQPLDPEVVPPPAPSLKITAGTPRTPLTEAIAILGTPQAAQEGLEIEVRIRGKVKASGEVEKLQNEGLVHGLKISPDSASVKIL